MKIINLKENLIKFIEKEIEYDSDGGKICPYCKKVIEKAHHWIANKSDLAGNINNFLGFKSGSWQDKEEMIFGEIENFYPVSCDKKKDAKELGEIIWGLFYD